MIIYPLIVLIHLILYNVRHFSNSSAMVELIVDYVQSHDYSTLMPQIQDIHVRKIAWSNCLSQSIDQHKLSCLFLLPWCIAITGYHTSSNNSNIQEQLMASYRQTSKLLLGASQPRRVKTTLDGMYTWQFKYANTIPSVLSTSNDLIHGYITSIYYLLQSIRLLPSILSANYFVIMYAADNSQFMLAKQAWRVETTIPWQLENRSSQHHTLHCRYLEFH